MIVDSSEITELIERGEDSRTQFKESFRSIDALAAEIAAFLNTHGGRIIVGLTDDGQVKGLSREDIRKLNQWISNVCSQKIAPPVTRVTTANIKYEGKILVIIDVPRGKDKFYTASNTDVWVKVGADKHRATREELKRLLPESGNLYADETVFEETTIDDLDLRLFRRFYRSRTGEELSDSDLGIGEVLTNLKLMKDGHLTLAGILAFGKFPEKVVPSFMIKAVHFVGNSCAGLAYRDSRDITGNIAELFREGTSFLVSNLKHVQKGQDFNSVGLLEIPRIALEEALINALLHRNYFITSNIRLFVFDERVEIISPGTLPNTATVEGIKLGLHIERNPILVSMVRDMEGIPYRGVGTGIIRIINECKQEGIAVDLIDEGQTEQFKVIFYRKGYC